MNPQSKNASSRNGNLKKWKYQAISETDFMKLFLKIFLLNLGEY